MGKPLGMTAGFKIVVPSRTQDKIWDVVAEAISEHCTPERFMSEVQEAWAHTLRANTESELAQFEKARQ